tara:strand:+ start:1236 stop:1472 length:237 start_codon:yes stop_codon:yes gene_type:complete
LLSGENKISGRFSKLFIYITLIYYFKIKIKIKNKIKNKIKIKNYIIKIYNEQNVEHNISYRLSWSIYINDHRHLNDII